MKKFMLVASVLALATAASANVQFMWDLSTMPADHGYPTCSVNVVAPFGGPGGGTYPAMVTGPAGGPLRYFALVSQDAALGQGFFLITSATMTFDCGGTPVSYTKNWNPAPFQPNSFQYLAGIPGFPVDPVDFGVDTNADCTPPTGGTDDLPVAFNLQDAFPNPFNPSTTISFALPQSEMIKLNVFNITGQKVATLVNGMLDRGTHELVFDASALSSGVYLYTIEAGSFTETKKMVLVK